jgi:hypothetical protein
MTKNVTGKGLLYIVRGLEDLATNTSRDGVTAPVKLLQMTSRPHSSLVDKKLKKGKSITY